ncbi:unnamed protein product [Effrenium voratum]|nr:unnamed protein product [Effrenium voratum]CAJ1455655.1 unnamed protein product [Effrenium voratum]
MDVLLLSQESLNLLLDGRASGLLRGTFTPKRGDIWLGLVAVGDVVARARLVAAHKLDEPGLRRAGEALLEQQKRLCYGTPHLWELDKVEQLAEPWRISSAARKGCVQWIPAHRWQSQHPEPVKRKQSGVTRAWPKRFPRKPRSDGRGPDLPQGLLLKQRRPKKGKREKRLSRNAPANPQDAISLDRHGQGADLSQRLRAGRTLPRLRHLASMSLFHHRRPFDAPPDPRPGRCALLRGNPCFIVSTFQRRKVPMADVLPLQETLDEAILTASRADTETCAQRDLQDVGCKRVQIQPRNLRKGRLRFNVLPAACEPGAADAHDVQVYLGPLQASAERPTAPAAAGEIIRVEPAAASEHKSSLVDGRWHQVVVPWCEFKDAARYRLCIRFQMVGSLAACCIAVLFFAPSIQVRRDLSQRAIFLLDTPLPYLLDTRPERCLTCGKSYPVKPSDIRRHFPTALSCRTSKQRVVWFSGRLLVQAVQKFAEVPTAAAVKRYLLDLYASNSLDLATAQQQLGVLSCLPRLRALRGVLRQALMSYLPGLVEEIQKSAHVYSGSAVKGDGNFKIAARIKGARPATAVIYGWCGVDGCLLKPCELMPVESWAYIRPDLEKLADQMRANREAAGLAQHEIPPVYHSTDTYAKHRKLLRSFWRRKYSTGVQSVSSTARGDAYSVAPGPDRDPTRITGDPQHEVLALGRLVPPTSSDGPTFVADHRNLMERLSLPPSPHPTCPADHVFQELRQDLQPLLQEAVRNRRFDLDASSASDQEKKDMRDFLGQAYASRAQSWLGIFGSSPPRQTLARLCGRFGVKIHDTEGNYNVRDATDFVAEVRRILRWYRHRKRSTLLRRRQVLRERQQRIIPGKTGVLSKKVRAHLRRLRRPVRVESFMHWRDMAIQTLRAGIAVQSGTVCVERYWAALLNYIAPQVRQMSPAWWFVLAQLSFAKWNYQHFSLDALPGIAERDAEIQSKLSTCTLLARALHDSELSEAIGLHDLFDPFRHDDDAQFADVR